MALYEGHFNLKRVIPSDGCGESLGGCGCLIIIVLAVGSFIYDRIHRPPIDNSNSVTRKEKKAPTPKPSPPLMNREKAEKKLQAILSTIYDALNEGDLQKIQSIVSPEVLSSTEKLDSICRPYTHRAHHIEGVIERPNQVYEARIRALFQPFDERAYTLVFSTIQDSLVLQDIKSLYPAEHQWAISSEDDWFSAGKAQAQDVVRRFVYAAKAERWEVADKLVSKGIDLYSFKSSPCWRALFNAISAVRITAVQVVSYRGLKFEVSTQGDNTFSSFPGTFLVDRIDGEYKIVKAFDDMPTLTFNDPQQTCTNRNDIRTLEDANMEKYTLERFGH